MVEVIAVENMALLVYCESNALDWSNEFHEV